MVQDAGVVCFRLELVAVFDAPVEVDFVGARGIASDALVCEGQGGVVAEDVGHVEAFASDPEGGGCEG